MSDSDKSDFKSDIDTIKKEVGEIKGTLARIERSLGSDIESVNNRLSKIDKEVARIDIRLGEFATESRRSSLFLAFLGLCATVMLSGIALVATGGDYVSGGKVLSVAGIAGILLIPVAWKRSDIYYRVGYGLAVVCVVTWLSLTYAGVEASFGRVALWVLGVPGVLLLVLGLFRLHRG